MTETAKARYLILGAGAAGISAAEKIRERRKEAELTVVSRENNMPISPVALPEYIEGSISKDELFLWDRSYVEENGIELMLNSEAIRIDHRDNSVILANGKSLSFERLLIATGAKPILTPDLLRKDRVFALRTLEDAEGIIRCAKERVIIYGAGAIAIKAAVALRRRGVEVIVICRSRVLRRLFDDDLCGEINCQLVANGVKIVGSCEFNSCSSDKKALVGDEEVSYDCIVAAMGVKPSFPPLNNGAIGLGRTGGIAVDDCMQTTVPGIYAAGDCVETLDITTGKRGVMALWPPAAEEGKVAAINMIGESATYAGTLPSNVIEVFGNSFVTMGSLTGHKLNLPGRDGSIRLTTRGGKIVGCQMVGDVEGAGAFASFIRNQTRVSDLKRLGILPYGKALQADLLLSQIRARKNAASQ